MAQLRGADGLQVFPDSEAGNPGKRLECHGIRSGSEPLRNPHPTPQVAPDRARKSGWSPTDHGLLPTMARLRAALGYLPTEQRP